MATLDKGTCSKGKYMQGGNTDLFVPKAFASVLHYVGFEPEAADINSKFCNREYCYTSHDPNSKEFSSYGVKVLPKWLQLKSKDIKNLDWQLQLEQSDIFLGGMVGADSIANHAVAIYNNWIFDANEKMLYHCAKKA